MQRNSLKLMGFFFIAACLLGAALCLLWLGPLVGAAAPLPTAVPPAAGTVVEFPGIDQLVPLTAVLLKGLGLDIVRRLVQQHGGQVELSSRPGRTVFRVTLPVT